MSGKGYREALKRWAPDSVVSVVRTLRQTINGPAIEDVVLRPFTFVPEDSTRPRLNLVLPSLSARAAFGGVATGLDLFFDLAAALCRYEDFSLRMIVEKPTPRNDDVLARRSESERGLLRNVEIIHTGAQAAIPTRPSDFFIAFNWWANLNIRPLIRQQASHYGNEQKPLLYLFQEYEPHFYAFSSAHMYAMEALRNSDKLFAVINSSELAEYTAAQGHTFTRSFVFEPKLPIGLSSCLNPEPAPERERLIFVYGRPSVIRNCFSIVRESLREFVSKHPQFGDWRFISAGEPHDRIPLGNGRHLESAGKLSLEGYGNLLNRASVGLSLMSSPHPSYPPLEMAHFGLLTLTNRYAHKDLSRYHENIMSLPDIMPQTVAGELANACTRFEKDPTIGAKGRALVDSYRNPDRFECLPQLTTAMLECLA